MLLWTSVIIPQHRELAVLGSQVCYLVHSNWPPRFSPPVLIYLETIPKEGAQSFQHRVNLPWRSVPCGKVNDDEERLTGSLNRSTSSVWTARDVSEAIVFPEAIHTWWGMVKHRDGFPIPSLGACGHHLLRLHTPMCK